MSKEQRGENPGSRVSRRDFFRTGAAAGTLTGALASSALATAKNVPSETDVSGPGTLPLRLNVNGQVHQLELEPRVTLLDALRNRLDVTGPKKVCDRGTCGSCTVLLDGQAVYACSILAVEAAGHRIETVESLGSPDNLSALQASFVEHDASQCGFCTPGFVVASKVLLDQHPQPTDEEIKLGLGGNLCRCGTYAGIQAVLREQVKGGSRNG